jgi:hypothetical protein
MIQISFQPAFDPFHAAFRFLRMHSILAEHRSLHFDQLRIMDFFLLFPFRVGRIRFKTQHRRFRRLAEEYLDRKPYGELPDDRLLFDRMEPFHVAALESLRSHGYLKPSDDLSLVSIAAPLPPGLTERIQSENKRDQSLLEMLSVLASEYELMGRDGLKDRSDLLDYRYDAV